ncbi:amino acid/amide ABC transporter membrane protein 2 (HAAT family) [Paucimonas lemoignei]|uniref:Amino acid/amide ABC transporter membrane protein 2 (HAAT family) n=1 Tax=Paucimonas lemoignei TaxID=29443 RepID=A0A4R3HNN0_PAULE|nr:branched-chain amino acid ABC transporter permease [Paucimonas lemoignei]TCS31849.1 amino acid/amide ABC transporter membrane protein 2 (HAAT family) [Paucimonas lemoignei]
MTTMKHSLDKAVAAPALAVKPVGTALLVKILLAVVLIVLVALPTVLSTSLVNAAIQMLIMALFASAFNVLAGQGGMLSFGHAAYFGIGAFATLHAMNAVSGQGLLPTPLLPVFGALGGAAVGLVAGWFSSKRSGVYFSMITLALAELLHALAPHLKSVFGGESGVPSMRMPAWGFTFGSATEVYYLTLAWVVVSIALLFFFTRTPLGRLTLGLRENAHRLKFLGYNVHMARVMVFVISATFAGIAGGLLAMSNEAANYSVFEVRLSSEVVLNSYIGGVGVFFGPALGAAVMTFFGYAVSDLTRSWLLYQGIIFVAVMMFMPNGLSGIITWWRTSKFASTTKLGYVLGWTIGTLTCAAGVVFLVELLQRLLSDDYQFQLVQGQPWPALNLFGQAWLPGAVVTWLVPLVLLAIGGVILKLTSARWQALNDREA